MGNACTYSDHALTACTNRAAMAGLITAVWLFFFDLDCSFLFFFLPHFLPHEPHSFRFTTRLPSPTAVGRHPQVPRASSRLLLRRLQSPSVVCARSSIAQVIDVKKNVAMRVRSVSASASASLERADDNGCVYYR